MKFFLDNCLAIRHARALNEMVKPDHSFTHLQEKFPPDTTDEEWIRTLGNEGEWIVLSGDYRIGKSQYGKRAWHESGLVSWNCRLCDRTRAGVRSGKAAGHDCQSRPLVSSIHALPLGQVKLEQLLERPSRPNPRAVPAWPARIYKQELFNPWSKQLSISGSTWPKRIWM